METPEKTEPDEATDAVPATKPTKQKKRKASPPDGYQPRPVPPPPATPSRTPLRLLFAATVLILGAAVGYGIADLLAHREAQVAK